MNKTKTIELVKKEFPNIKWKNIQYETGKHFNVLILDKRNVFRILKDNISKNILSSEIEILNKIKKTITKTVIPNYDFINEDLSIARCQYIEGCSIQKNLIKKNNQIIKELALFLTELHSFPVKNLPKSVEKIDIYVWSLKLKNTLKKSIYKKLKKEEIKTIDDFLKYEIKLMRNIPKLVLAHVDLYIGQMVWNEKKKKLGVFDFGDASRTDPAVDFAFLYDYGKEFVHKVYSLYKGPKDDNFIERAFAHYRCIPLNMMVYSEDNFHYGYELFLKRFKLK